ncbi:hypothetical protein EX30DRAFT_244219 [Ascodesmis nigricans]|uniref:Membrane anchor Opy2 N-terminal domain-containing protein n=1 Tax=Ascodesmis nigricans TaxID=341454 RepID=A0A4S2MIF0_9PEZI|nr:hypothetical protein EX30DRAFT_244219 [Ascodesmis nigricans]
MAAVPARFTVATVMVAFAAVGVEGSMPNYLIHEHLNDLFRREDGCIECATANCLSCQKKNPDDPPPTCTVTVRTCDTCPVIKCYPRSAPKEDDGPSTGAIVGATLGALAAVVLVAFFVWRYCYKKRRRTPIIVSAAEKENDFGMLRSARASTHTVASIAETVRTRASNVIQIAYIPGVQNRSGPSTPGMLNVPPVPPLPGATGSPSLGYPAHSPSGDIQFGADDLLRGSFVTVNDDGRSNYRSSVATTIYGREAQVEQVQQSAVRVVGKAGMIQVRGGGSSNNSSTGTSPADVPAVPSLFTTGANHGDKPNEVPSSPTYSMSDRFLSARRRSSERDNRKSDWESTTTADFTEPLVHRRPVPGRQHHTIPENHSTHSYIDEEDEEDSDMDLTPTQRSAKKFQSQCSSCVTDMETGSPFSDSNIIDPMQIPAGAGLPPMSAGFNDSLSMNLSSPRRVGSTRSPFSDPMEDRKGR